jgi:formamidopyrimidine-DNA glycosylase
VPELPEVEAYRRLLAAHALGRPVADVLAPDPWYLKGGASGRAVRLAVRGRQFSAARRIGKLALLDTKGGPTLGLHFGMTGRLLLDGVAGVDRLQYASSRDNPAWDRFVITFADGGRLAMRDPRRLGGVWLDPDEGRLGPDALTLSPGQLRDALAGSHAPLKARLMDQRRIAGVGNLMADEALWRAGLHPARAAGSLSAAEERRLHRHLRATVDDLIARGGSHAGDLARLLNGRCPRDGEALVRATVGGRTTFWCPHHQR